MFSRHPGKHIRLLPVRGGMTFTSTLATIPRYDALDRKHHTSASLSGKASAEPTPQHAGGAVTFAGFRLEADGSLHRGKALIHLPPRELAALRILLASPGQIVTPTQLKKALWGDVHVTADSVPKCLSSLRARLEPSDCIQTVYKRGYRLLAEVHAEHVTASDALPRLAITPFNTDIGVPEHLGPAIAEEAIARLSNAPVPLVSMLARDSIFTLARRGLTAQQVGEALHADLVLAGTLRSYSSHFRLRVEMIRSVDGVQIWVEDFLVEREKIAGLESDLAERIEFRLHSGPLETWRRYRQSPGRPEPGAEGAAAVHPSSVSPAKAGSAKAGTAQSISISAAAERLPEAASGSQSREAYELFLRGRHEWQTLERHRMQDGLQHLTRATDLDPSLLAAKINLIQLCVTQAFYGYMPSALAADLLRRTADSIANDPRHVEAVLPALGWVRLNVERNLSAARWAFAKSHRLPHTAFNTRERVMFCLSQHRFEEAAALSDAALREDPFSPWLHARQPWIAHLAGHAEQSVELAYRGLEQFPGHDGVALYASIVLAFNGKADESIRLAEGLVQRQPHIDALAAVHAYALACAGRSAEARAILERLQWLSRERFVLKSFQPAVHVVLGDLDAAVSDLRAANQDRCPWFLQMLADPRLKPLHGHAGFEELRAIVPRLEEAARADAEEESGRS